MQLIILASQSPRRKQLLEWAEVPFEIMVQSTDESYPDSLPVNEIPVFIARQKALAIQQEIRQHRPAKNKCPILAADTVVVLGDRIIGKPVDRRDAIQIISSLSGQCHKVITGVVILHDNTESSFYDITEVEFHTLTEEQIVYYVDKYKPFDKAGAYAIQEWIGVVGIKKVTGDFYNVMGLPVSRVVQCLEKIA